jgi:hypothetical protein
MTHQDSLSRIENKSEVEAYLARIKYALENSHTEIKFQRNRIIDASRDEQYTNEFTVHDLFPNDNPVEAIKRELLRLEAENYIETVKDKKFVHRSEM